MDGVNHGMTVERWRGQRKTTAERLAIKETSAPQETKLEQCWDVTDVTLFRKLKIDWECVRGHCPDQNALRTNRENERQWASVSWKRILTVAGNG